LSKKLRTEARLKKESRRIYIGQA